jgi:hypothetical protein
MYVERSDGSVRFRSVNALTSAELTRLIQTLALRIGQYLEWQGLLEEGGTKRPSAGHPRAARVCSYIPPNLTSVRGALMAQLLGNKGQN